MKKEGVSPDTRREKEASTNTWDVDEQFELTPTFSKTALHRSFTSHFPQIIKMYRSFLHLKLYSLNQISFSGTISAFPLFP